MLAPLLGALYRAFSLPPPRRPPLALLIVFQTSVLTCPGASRMQRALSVTATVFAIPFGIVRPVAGITLFLRKGLARERGARTGYWSTYIAPFPNFIGHFVRRDFQPFVPLLGDLNFVDGFARRDCLPPGGRYFFSKFEATRNWKLRGWIDRTFVLKFKAFETGRSSCACFWTLGMVDSFGLIVHW